MISALYWLIRFVAAFIKGALVSTLAPSRGDEIMAAFRDGISASVQAREAWRAAKVRLLTDSIARIESVKTAPAGQPLRSAFGQIITGLFWMVLAAGLIYGEWFLVSWTLRLFAEIDDDRFLSILSLLATSALVLTLEATFEAVFDVIRDSSPRAAAIVRIILTTAPAVIVGTAILVLAYLRGEVLFLAAAGRLEDLKALEGFFSVNKPYVTLPMLLLTLGIGLVGGYALHLGPNVESLLRIFISLRLSWLRRRVARLDGTSRYDEKLAVVCVKAFDQGFFLADGIRAGLVNMWRRLARRAEPSWLRAGIIVIVFALLLLILTSWVWAASGTPKKKIVLLDTSASSAGDTVRMNASAIAAEVIKTLQPGDQVLVYAIKKDSFRAPLLFLEGAMPRSCGVMRMKCLRERDRLLGHWEEVGRTLAAPARETDLFGAIALASSTCRHMGDPCTIIIYSDMRHSTREMDFEAMAEIPASLIAVVKQKGHVPKLPGAEVYMLGVHTLGRDPRYYDSLERFWRAYFAEAGAGVKAFRAGRGLK
jgi:hypothetical protein